MKITDLKADQTFDFIIARILSRNGPKPVMVKGQRRYVWELLLRDATGTVILSLWGANTGELYKLNSVIKIVNGWTKVFRDQYQISLGKEGNIQVMPDDPTIPRTLV
ncbi:MAG: hypothetical protein INQ03_06145 [Candidatus Heimdallarchaeota archaeon]|nr:hypothetical protein [Candidatus Heimdallarchaeota archaeon]